ncbi:hypothetical protein [Romboutsia sp.]|uniref:hypothetical protein n=1 Tax=Romboutsia sp. TaxID=1965302 RepID=UPI003F383C5D
MATIKFANPSTGPLASAIGWIDFGTLVLGPGNLVPGVSASFPDGSTITFDLSNTAVVSGGETFKASIPPVYGGAAFGNTGYLGINGNVVLYSVNITLPSATSLITLSNISVRDPLGNAITNYSIVAADGESTDQEQIVFKTNLPIWRSLINLPPVTPPPLGPSISGIGSSTVTISASGPIGQVQGPVIISNSPTQVSALVSVLQGQLEGVAFGIVLTKVTLIKDITKRIFSSDQFNLNITGIPSTINTTTGSTTGPQTSTEAIVYDVPPGNAYSFDEAMASGSFGLLSQYTQIVSATNVSGGTDVSGINTLGQSATTTIGDNIIVTIRNTPHPVSTKKIVDKSYAGINDILTYTIALVNASMNTAININIIDTIPNGTSIVAGSLTIDGVTIPGSPAPPSGITLATLVPDQLSTISFKVLVNTVPSPNLVQNSSTTNYSFSITTIPGGSFNSNIVTTTINSANLSSIKAVDKSVVSVGDTLNYTVTITNTGTTTAINVVFKDTIPNNTTFVQNSLMINSVAQPGANPSPPGYNITSIPVGTTTITFQVTVDTVPSPNPIPNSANIIYDYIVDPSIGNTNSGSTNSNIVNTKVNYADIKNPIKSVDISSADIGNILNYFIVLRNTGNTTANNVAFIDTIPNGTSFVVNSVLVNGTTIAGASPIPPTGVSVGDIGPSQISTVRFKVIVNTIPSPNPILNNGTATYQYILDPTIGSTARGSGVTNTVSTFVNNANLNTIKSVNKEFAMVGDTLIYTIGITNTGNTSANNIIFTDTIPTNTTLVINSLTVNGTTIAGSNPSPPAGVNIGTIPGGGTSTVTFKVTVNTIPSPNAILNSSTTQYSYIIDPTLGTSTTGSSNSNTVNTTVKDVVVSAIKSVNAANVLVGDNIIYTIVFNNTGNTTANNLVFIDTIPNGTSFVSNSLQINGIQQTGATVAPPNGVSLPNLGINQTSTLTFKVTAITVPTPNPTINTGTTKFDFIVDPTLGTTGIGGGNTNSVSTFINENTNLIKSVDKGYATLSDTLTYTLSLKNTLSIDQNNLVFIDTIPTGTTFVPDSIKINTVPQIGSTIEPPSGLSLGTLAAGQSLTVTFDVIVSTIPSPNPIANNATSTFSYIVDPTLGTSFTSGNISNTVTTTINIAKISNLNKQVDKSFTTIGDTLTYTISFNNTGTTTALNLIFKDTIPTGTTYVPNSFTINSATQPGQSPEYPTGVNIGNIPVGSITTLGFQVKVSTISLGNIIINGGTVLYDYIVNDQTGQRNSSGGNTNLVYTTTNFADLSNPIKSVDNNFADIGTTITYTVALTNSGNQTADNVAFIDTIPNGTSFIPDSVTVNGIPQIGSSPIPPTGISVGSIMGSQTSIITFEVIVNTIPSPNPIPNKGTATYDFIVDPTLSISIRNSNVTNEVDTLVNHADLLNTKSVDKKFAKLGDVVNYSIGIANTGNTTAYNIVFTDTIPTDTTFVLNSLKINGITQTGKNPSPPTGVSIGTIPAKSTSTVTFAVVISTVPSPNPISNSSTTTFSYTVDPVLGIGVNSSGNSNIVSTTINNATIKGTKSVNMSDAFVGDVITYSIDLLNSGNVSTNNISFVDTIPNGTQFVQNSVAINGVTVPGATVAPPAGAILPNLSPGGSVNIQFKVLVTTVPTPNPTLNTGTAKYNFTVDPVLGIKVNEAFNTNTVPTFISPNTKPVKSVNTKYATVGDTLTYTLVWKNVLNTEQTDLVFIDTIPDSTTFIPGSITVNGSPQIGASISPPDGLYIGTVGKGAVVTVTYDVIVDTLPNNNIIDNDMTVIFNYVSNKELGTISRKSAVSNVVDTKVNLARIENPIKSVDKESATIGDVLTYTITFENTGNTNANNTIFKDTIPQGTTFVPNSFTLNGVVQYGRNPGDPAGVNLGIISAGAITTLTFKVVVDNELSVKDIYNSGTLGYDYIVNPESGRSKSNTVDTNTVLTKIIAAIISGKKTASCCTGFVGMQIKYTIVLENVGNTIAYNVHFVDTIPNGTAFVPNSVTLNSMSFPGATVYPPTGVTIGNLGINEVITVAFMVNVETLPCPNPISNYGTVKFSYDINQDTDGQINKSSNTNIAQTYIDPCSYFTKMYQDLYEQSQILDKEHNELVCKAKELEEQAKEFEEKAKIECFKAKVALEKGNKLNAQANSALELAAFYSQQALECRKNIHNLRNK